MGAEKGRIINAAQLMADEITPMTATSIPVVLNAALRVALLIEWAMQTTVYATNSIMKFRLAISKNFFLVVVLLIKSLLFKFIYVSALLNSKIHAK